MNKTLSVIFFLLFVSSAIGQVIGRVDKKSKQFFIPSDQKIEYRVFGYLGPRITTSKMICFSTHAGDVTANYNNCPLGAYYDTGRMKIGDNITYAGMLGDFGRMIFIAANGKKTIFYLPKSNFVIK
jgi:hypothetical protein